MTLNGILAGLVGVTAGADVVTPLSAIIIGLIAGVIVVGSVITMGQDRDRRSGRGGIGTICVCGIWGTIAVGLFIDNPDHSLGTQLSAVAAYAVAAIGGSAAIFYPRESSSWGFA